jgi:two-component system, NtrC family, sensor kinase
MSPQTRELEFFKFVDTLSNRLKPMREPRKALAHALRESRDFFQATRGCVAVADEGQPTARLLVTLPREGHWDLQHIGNFIRHSHPPARDDVMMAPVRRRGAAWGALALMRSHPIFDRHDRRLLARTAAAVSEAIQFMDRERMLGVRDRIDRKIMEQIDPKDLFYQILDGLRSLTHYDHSSALLIRENSEDELRVVAEQIAWTKARSERIGLTLPLDADVRSVLESAEIHGFDRRGEVWTEWSGKRVTRLAELLDYNRDSLSRAESSDLSRAESSGPGAGATREASMLCAPLVTREGIFGVLKVAARHPGRLRPFDAELVDRFRSQAAVAIQNLTRTESLRARLLTAERRHAMAELARTVSHDVNNALGSMLPLVQQMQEDLQSGKFEPAVYLEDLEQVQKSLQVCRRIFGGMLFFAKGGARRTRPGHVWRALETSLAVLKDGMARRGIDLVVDAPDDLPPIACGQSDLEQVFLNLLTNAREASAEGGTVSVRIEPDQAGVVITVADTGSGIAPEDLPRIFEPFFTTKSTGNGLGLSICRSILWEVRGTLNLQSEPAKGTRVHVTVPWASPVSTSTSLEAHSHAAE